MRVTSVRLDQLMGPGSLPNNSMLFMGQFELWLNNGHLWTILVCLCLWVSGYVSCYDLKHKIIRIKNYVGCLIRNGKASRMRERATLWNS